MAQGGGGHIAVAGAERSKAPSAIAYSEAVGACEALVNVIAQLEDRLEPLLMSGPPQPVPDVPKGAEASRVTAQFHELMERVVGSRETLQRLIERLDC